MSQNRSTDDFKQLLRSIVANNIKTIRKAKGMRQSELSRRLNVHRQQLSYYEVAKNLPPLDVVVMIAKVLDCSVADIYTPDKLDSLKNLIDLDDVFSRSKN